MERSIRFYCDALDMTVARRFDPAGLTEASLKFKGAPTAPGIMLMCRDGEAGGDAELPTPERAAAASRHAAGLPQTGYSRLIFLVEDLDAVCRRMRQAGGRVGQVRGSTEVDGRLVFVKDPDGYILEVIEGDVVGL
jgi:catechol 2,3-dioxygenase-like lactoylglutathione lyase family enzyme